jgi:hypothetical protein
MLTYSGALTNSWRRCARAAAQIWKKSCPRRTTKMPDILLVNAMRRIAQRDTQFADIK